MADPGLLKKDDPRFAAIGYVRASKATFEVTLWLPPLVCWRLGDAMAAGLVTSMTAVSGIANQSIHRISSVSFFGPYFDPVAYVG